MSQKWGGGALLDFYNVTWPGASLIIDDYHLTLKVAKLWMFGGTFKFTRDEVEKITPTARWLLPGIRIHHKISSYPDCVIFWNLSYKEILQKLTEYEYNVSK